MGSMSYTGDEAEYGVVLDVLQSRRSRQSVKKAKQTDGDTAESPRSRYYDKTIVFVGTRCRYMSMDARWLEP